MQLMNYKITIHQCTVGKIAETSGKLITLTREIYRQASAETIRELERIGPDQEKDFTRSLANKNLLSYRKQSVPLQGNFLRKAMSVFLTHNSQTLIEITNFLK